MVRLFISVLFLIPFDLVWAQSQMKTQEVQAQKNSDARPAATGSPAMGPGNRPPSSAVNSAGRPIVIPVVQQQQSSGQQDSTDLSQFLGAVTPLMQAMQGMNYKQGGDEVPSGVDWNKYSYPDNFRFRYGGVGAGNIGNGLCTNNNRDRTQVKEGYCKILRDLLNNEGSCASQQLQRIIAIAGSDGRGIGDLNNYCSNYGQLRSNDQKKDVFLQVLAGLIVKESGWRTDAREPAWTRADGLSMGGRGLFQIGVRDRSNPDCGELNDRSIFDPRVNLKCGACIALTNLAKDATMGHGVGDRGARGLARYFGPFRDGQHAKRRDIAASVNTWCMSNVGATPGGANSTAR
jgi:hypothetical protein